MFPILKLLFPILSIKTRIFNISINCSPSQLAHDVVTTLGFGCILVATLDNIVTTLSQRCVSGVVTTTKN